MQVKGCTVVRQGHFIAVVGAFLMGCAVLVVAGCSGERSEASKQEEQGHTEATASEEARCEGTRTFKPTKSSIFLMTTNDIPGCPNKGGLLSGTDNDDWLAGKDGDDEIHGLGGVDDIEGGGGNDVIHGGPGNEFLLINGGAGDDVIYGGPGHDAISGDEGEDVLYGGDGDELLSGLDEGPKDTQRDELYCGPGKDLYETGKLDYVDSSCEKRAPKMKPATVD